MSGSFRSRSTRCSGRTSRGRRPCRGRCGRAPIFLGQRRSSSAACSAGVWVSAISLRWASWARWVAARSRASAARFLVSRADRPPAAIRSSGTASRSRISASRCGGGAANSSRTAAVRLCRVSSSVGGSIRTRPPETGRSSMSRPWAWACARAHLARGRPSRRAGRCPPASGCRCAAAARRSRGSHRHDRALDRPLPLLDGLAERGVGGLPGDLRDVSDVLPRGAAGAVWHRTATFVNMRGWGRAR